MNSTLTTEKTARVSKSTTIRVLVKVMVAIAVLVLTSGYIWARFIYKPDLSVYSVAFLDPQGHQLRDLKLEQPDAFEDLSTAIVPYKQDLIVVAHYWLNSSASVEPTIEGIPVGIDTHSAHLLSPENVYVGSPPRGGDSFGLQNFHPFKPMTVPSGRGLAILVVYRVGNCRFNLPGGRTTVTALPVRYSILGIVHEVVLSPLENLAVESPPKKECPE